MGIPLLSHPALKIGCGDPGDPIDFSGFFEIGANYLSSAVTAANTREAVIDYKFKNVGSDGTERLHIATTLAGSGQYFYTGLGSSDQFLVYDGPAASPTFNLSSMGVFRDKAAHLNPHVRINTAELVASDRVQLWMNGHRMILTGTFPTQDADMNYLGGSQTHYVGSWGGGIGTPGGGVDTILSDVVYEDSITPQLEDFGRFNSDGHWVNKTYTGSAVYNLPFSDALNMGLNLAGADFTVNGTVTQSTDTPTKNLTTLEPNDPTSGTMSEGNTVTSSSTSGYNPTPLTIRIPDVGDWYAEFEQISGNTGVVGVMNMDDHPTNTQPLGTISENGGFEYYALDGSLRTNGTALAQSGGASYSTGDRIGVRANRDTGNFEFSKNGVLQYTQSIPVGITYAFATGGWNWSNVDVMRYIKEPSENLHVPEGSVVLSVPNLDCPEILDPTDYYHREELTSGADLVTNWNPLTDDTIVITGRTDSPQEYRANMIIGGVQVNPFNTAGTGAEIVGEDGFTFTATGATVGTATPYQGTRFDRAFRCNPKSGMALVTINHTNGVPTVVNHDAGGVAEEVTFFPVSGGDRRVFNKFVGGDAYIRMNEFGTTADAGFVSANAVGQFTVDGSLPSGVYRLWIKRSVSQFSSVFKYRGNNVVDGAFVPLDFLAAFLTTAALNTSAGEYVIKDNLGVNPDTTSRALSETTGNDVVSWDMGFYSNGVKWRNTYAETNGSEDYVGFAVAKTPLKFANGQ